MFCKHCGKSIAENSAFCEFCGGSIGEGRSIEPEKRRPVEEKKDSATIWDKFVEIFDSEGRQRDSYIALTPAETWEIIGKLPTNYCETFLSEHKEVLNKQPYKAIESIEQAFKGSFLVGYWIWLAQYLNRNERVGKVGDISQADLIKEWATISEKEQPSFIKNVSEELALPFVTMSKHRMENLFESAPTIKEVPNEIVESLKTSIFIQMIWGYMLGKAENRFRK
ncbi:MAG TPA: zinc ribbon domain-containing protein [Candidatus Paceibacterota bacterium]|nr:zinc ribbon domain-containing protein [Candidatus Paceibacterota bacterium]